MRSHVFAAVACTVAVFLAAGPASYAVEEGAGDKQLSVAKRFGDDLGAGRYKKACENFDATMKGAMPPDRLASMWKGLEGQLGAFKSFGPSVYTKRPDNDYVVMETKFEKQTVWIRLVFDRQARIAGLWVDPSPKSQTPDGAAAAAGYKLPKYADENKYAEEPAAFGPEEWRARGLLTIPRGEGRVPAVVLVHGSGPHDEDETIGPNKPFKDLAAGLASRGIAVLRYRKRTYAYRMRLAAEGRITIREEVVDDALEALKYVRAHPRVNPDRVFVVGHSLGATMTPQIAREDGKVAGAVLFAGTARDLTDVLLEQLAYIASLPLPNQADNQKLYDEALATILKVRNKELGEDARLLNVPLAYWNEVGEAAGRSLQIAKELKCRLLIASGGRDYQVTRKDFDLYKRELKGRPNVTLKWFKQCNHLFFGGREMSTPQEYSQPGHVDGKVVKYLADWILEDE